MARKPSRPSTIPFVEFCERALRVEFSRAQRVAFRVLFDGVEPRQLSGDARDLAREIFGAVETVPPVARRVAVLAKGARIGGTRFSTTRLVHLAMTVPLPSLGPGERAYGIVVGPDMRLARQGLSFALGAAKQAFPDRVGAVTADGFELTRDDGIAVSISCLPATAGGSAVRGRTLVGAVMTEAAFFHDANSVVNDEEIYRALLPRVVRGGQLIIESTPWAQLGLLFALFDRNHGKPYDALVACCPTQLMREDPETHAFVEALRARDPDGCAREHDVVFLGLGSSLFFDPTAIDAMVDGDLAHPGPFDPRAGKATAGDFAFTADHSALTILQQRAGRVWLALVDEMAPSPGSPLAPGVVSRRFAGHMRAFESRELIVDGHYVESVREHVTPYGIRLIAAPGGNQGKFDVHTAAREVIHDGTIKIPKLPRLVAQLKGIVSRPLPGGGTKIDFPRRRGLAHGDVASAFVLSCWAIKVGRMTAAERAAYHRRTIQYEAKFGGVLGLGDGGVDLSEFNVPWGSPAWKAAQERIAAGESPAQAVVPLTLERAAEHRATHELPTDDPNYRRTPGSMTRREAEAWARLCASTPTDDRRDQ